jgi:hypothetical protein
MQEIEVAARSAQMHDRIMTFPDGECRAMEIMIFSDATKVMRPKLVNVVSD